MDPNTEYENLKKELDDKLTVTTDQDSESSGLSDDSNQDDVELAPIYNPQSKSKGKEVMEGNSGEGSSKTFQMQTVEVCSSCFLNEMDYKYQGQESVVLKCEGGEEIYVPVPLGMQSGYVRNTLEVGINGNIIPIPLVPVQVLFMLMEYWNMHVGEEMFDEFQAKEINEWEEEYFHSELDGCTRVFGRGTEFVAELIRKMKVDEIRKYFGMKNDFTPEEEQLKKDFPWAYADDA